MGEYPIQATLTPLRDKALVRVLPMPETTGLIHRAPTETPLRRVEVLAVGPDAKELAVGGTYLAILSAGQQFMDDQVLLPAKPGRSAFLCQLRESPPTTGQ